MKKFLGILVACAAAFALCMGLVGCGGTAASSDAPDAATFVGSYELASMESDGSQVGEEDLALAKSLGYEVGLELKEDMTFSINVFGESIDGTWEVKSADVLTFTIDGQSVDATVDGDTVVLTENATSMTFTKKAA